jgi:acyl-CoA thioesterase
MEVRLAKGRFYNDPDEVARSSDGRVIFWIRTIERYDPGGWMAALVGDYLTTAIVNAVDRPVRITSLDNTIRFISPDLSDWLLCDIHIEGYARGFAHGTMYIFSDTGRLLALGSQSTVVRETQPS